MILFTTIFTILSLLFSFGALGSGLLILLTFQYRPNARLIGLHPIVGGCIGLAYCLSYIGDSIEGTLFWAKLALCLGLFNQLLAHIGLHYFRGRSRQDSHPLWGVFQETPALISLIIITSLSSVFVWLNGGLFFQDVTRVDAGWLHIWQVEPSAWYIGAASVIALNVMFTVAFVVLHFELNEKISPTRIQIEAIIVLLLNLLVIPISLDIAGYPLPILGALGAPLLGLYYLVTFAIWKPDLRPQPAAGANPMAWHDLRNIATALDEQMKILRNQVGINEQFLSQLANMEQAMSELQNYMNQVNLPKSSRPRQTMEDEVWVNGIVSDTCAFWGRIAQEHDLTWQTDLTAEDIFVTLDGIWFKRLLDNLLHNAIKFTPTLGTISFSTQIQEDCYQIRVSDTGIGIPKQDQPRIFDEYTRASNATSFKGTGLGLASVVAFAEHYHAALDLQSSVGEGTTITLRLPLDQ